LRARVGDEAVRFLDATGLAEKLLGDAIYSNVLVLGAAWQAGLVPLSAEAIRRAIELNGAGVKGNLAAFEIGRWAAHDLTATIAAMHAPKTPENTVEERIAMREAHVRDWGDAAWAQRYRGLVDQALGVDADLGWAVAQGAHKLMTYKDEFEVARLHVETLEAALDAQFSKRKRVRFHMAPPFLGRKDAQGRPKKTQFGPWMFWALKRMAGAKRWRGTWLDLFSRTEERRMERALIDQYFADMADILARVDPATRDAAIALAELPLTIRGFGHVKKANADTAALRRDELLAVLRAGGAPATQAAE
ncbi:MAG: DUF6537 domain-containing protein, partial [Pseudomonadota bacterium]